MIKHRKDSDALLEAFHLVQLDEEDKTPYDGHDEKETEKDSDKEDVKEESVARMPEDEIYMATGRVNGGDWEGGIERVMAAIGNYIIDDIGNSGAGSPLDNPDSARSFCLKEYIEMAVEDLLGGANAAGYEELKKSFQQAFHKATPSKEDLSSFFEGEPPLGSN